MPVPLTHTKFRIRLRPKLHTRIAALASTVVIAVASAVTVDVSTAVVAAQAAAPLPYTSPGVTRIYRNGDANPGQCSSGYLCAYADYGGGWYEFKFVHCGLYHLYYWHDTSVIKADSFVIDDQTGGVTTTYYGQNGNVLQRMKPKANDFQYVLDGKGGWDPVYSIRVC